MSKFKYVCLFFCVFLARENLWAGEDLRSFSNTVMSEISKELDENSIRGWESHRLLDDEVLVKVYTSDGMVFEFHCDDVNTCQKIDQFPTSISFAQDAGITLDWITIGRDASFDKLEKTSQSKSLVLGTLNTYKVWVHEESGHGHDGGLNIWTQMVHENMTVFILCHGHAGDAELFCHYRKSPAGGFDHEDHHEHEQEHQH